MGLYLIPHKVRLRHCGWCDEQIRVQWNLALRSRYETHDEYEENEPRADHPFDIDLDEDKW